LPGPPPAASGDLTDRSASDRPNPVSPRVICRCSRWASMPGHPGLGRGSGRRPAIEGRRRRRVGRGHHRRHGRHPPTEPEVEMPPLTQRSPHPPFTSRVGLRVRCASVTPFAGGCSLDRRRPRRVAVSGIRGGVPGGSPDARFRKARARGTHEHRHSVRRPDDCKMVELCGAVWSRSLA